MGWWNQNSEGHSFSGDGSLMWGDSPADSMDEALRNIVYEFERQLGRKPTATEILAGVKFSLPALDLVSETTTKNGSA